MLGQVSSKLGDFKSGVYYGLLALKTAEAVKDNTMLLCTIYNQLGITYFMAKDLKAATNCFKNALRIAQQYNDFNSIRQIKMNLSSTSTDYVQNIRLLKSLEKISPALHDKSLIYSRLAHYYQKLHQYKSAREYCDQFEKLKQGLAGADQADFAGSYFVMISYYIDTHQYSKAHSLLIDLTETSKRMSGKSTELNAQRSWFKLDSAQRNYPSAIAHYQRYSFLKDSLLTAGLSYKMSK